MIFRDRDIYLKIGLSYDYQYRKTSYEAKGDEQNTINYFDKLISDEKYNYDAYKAYYDYLKSRYNNTKEQHYKDKTNQLQKLYKYNLVFDTWRKQKAW